MSIPWGVVPPVDGASNMHGDRLTLEHTHGRRHEYVYLAADLFTDQAICELPMRNVQMSWQINKPGQMSGDVSVADFPRVRDYFNATVPGRTVVYVIRDGVPIWGGINWSRDFDSESRMLKIQADTWDSYMYHRISYENWLFYRDLTNPDKLYEGVEQIEVFRMLWRYMCNGPNNDIGVVLGEQTSPVKRGVNFSRWNFQTYGEQLEGFAALSNGFEWFATVGMSADGRSIERRIEFAYPKFGRTWKESNLVWEYPGTMTNYTWRSDADKAITAAYLLGQGDGDLRTHRIGVNQERLDDGFLRLDGKYDHPTVFDSAILDAHAAKYLVAYDPPLNEVTVGVHPRIPVQVGDYFVGDEVRLVINDDLFEHAGIGSRDLVARVGSLSLTPNDDGLEIVDPGLVIVSRDLAIVDEEDQNADLTPETYEGPAIDSPEVQPEPPGYGEDGEIESPRPPVVPHGRRAPWGFGMDSLQRSTRQGLNPWSGEPS